MNHDPELFDQLVSDCTKANARADAMRARIHAAQVELNEAMGAQQEARQELENYIQSLVMPETR